MDATSPSALTPTINFPAVPSRLAVIDHYILMSAGQECNRKHNVARNSSLHRYVRARHSASSFEIRGSRVNGALGRVTDVARARLLGAPAATLAPKSSPPKKTAPAVRGRSFRNRQRERPQPRPLKPRVLAPKAAAAAAAAQAAPGSTQENSPRGAGAFVSKPPEGAAAAATAQRSFKRTTPWQCQGVVCLNGAGGIRTPVPRRPLYRIYERVRDLNLVRGIRSRRAPTPDQPDCCLVPRR